MFGVQKTESRGHWSTHQSLAFILNVGKIFAIFPLDGIGNPESKFLKFRWGSLYSVYSLIVLAMSATVIGFQIHRICRVPTEFVYFGKTNATMI